MQTPFLSLGLDLNEVPDEQRSDFALLIEEIFKQRIKGMKNSSGYYVTTEFPKLLYMLDENNINPDSEYYYLTVLAAECAARRMTPDLISSKVMRKLKKNDTYFCMGKNYCSCKTL